MSHVIEDGKILAPIGMPFRTETLVVGFKRPLTHDMYELLSDTPTCTIVTRHIHAELEAISLDSRTLLRLKGIFDKDDVLTSSDRQVSVHFWQWLNDTRKTILDHDIQNRYRALKARLNHDYAYVHTSVDIYVDKMVVTLDAYYPDDLNDCEEIIATRHSRSAHTWR